jgi:hypothetical protein
MNGPQHGKYCGDTVASLLATDSQSTNCPVTLKASWQKQVLACSGYLELGMLDDAANALEEIQPDDTSRKEVLYAQVGLYVASKKWKMAAVVAGHLVKAEPANPDAWINLAYLVRRAENVEEAETVLFKARNWHPKNALIAFNLACYASVAGRMEEAKRAAVFFGKWAMVFFAFAATAAFLMFFLAALCCVLRCGEEKHPAYPPRAMAPFPCEFFRPRLLQLGRENHVPSRVRLCIAPNVDGNPGWRSA